MRRRFSVQEHCFGGILGTRSEGNNIVVVDHVVCRNASFFHADEAKNIATNEKVAVKCLRATSSGAATMAAEAALYKELAGEPGFAKLRWCGLQGVHNVIVMDLLGPSLHTLLGACGGRFSLKTVVMLADEMLVRIQTIHSRGFIHGDVKPDNFVVANQTSLDPHRIYAIDFGLAKKYWDFAQHSHLPFASGQPFSGTVRYCSITSHKGFKAARRDDLESIGYCLVYFLKGRLPWQGIESADKAEKRERVFRCKRETPLDELCEGVPPELKTYIRYCRELQYDELPAYDFLRGLFTSIAERERISYDECYDWIVMREEPAGAALQESASEGDCEIIEMAPDGV